MTEEIAARYLRFLPMARRQARRIANKTPWLRMCVEDVATEAAFAAARKPSAKCPTRAVIDASRKLSPAGLRRTTKMKARQPNQCYIGAFRKRSGRRAGEDVREIREFGVESIDADDVELRDLLALIRRGLELRAKRAGAGRKPNVERDFAIICGVVLDGLSWKAAWFAARGEGPQPRYSPTATISDCRNRAKEAARLVGLA